MSIIFWILQVIARLLSLSYQGLAASSSRFDRWLHLNQCETPAPVPVRDCSRLVGHGFLHECRVDFVDLHPNQAPGSPLLRCSFASFPNVSSHTFPYIPHIQAVISMVWHLSIPAHTVPLNPLSPRSSRNCTWTTPPAIPAR